MLPITKKKFNEQSNQYSYMKGRWPYCKFAIDYVMSHKTDSCLEIGPGYIPLFYDSDILDCRHISSRRPTLIWDVDDIPWPIKDKAYDFLIALHVLEHVKCPIEVFCEIKRVSYGIILGLPYRWGPKSRHSPSHWYIDEESIYKWTGLHPSTIKFIDFMCKNKKRTSIICIYDTGEIG